MEAEDLLEHLMRPLQDHLHAGRHDELKVMIEEQHPSVTAGAIVSLEPQEIGAILILLDPRMRSHIFSFLPPEVQVRVLSLLDDSTGVEIVTFLSHDERVDLLATLPPDMRRSIVSRLSRTDREDIRRLDAYPEETIGASMTSDFVSLRPGQSVADAMATIRREARDAETIYYAYVLGPDRRLSGVVSLKDLIMARPDARVDSIMRTETITLRVDGDPEEAIREMQNSDLLALPVVDAELRMVGIVTYDDIQDLAEEVSTDDFHRLGAAPGLAHISLKSATLGQMVQKRLPWLMVLVFMNVFSGAGIAYFENTIEAVVALVFFLPLLIDCGGNAGSQASTLVVRALATGDVQLRDWFRLLRKEIGVAICMGLCMAAAVSLIGVYRAGPEVAFVVALTMCCIVLTGSLIGMLFPLILTRLKMDPATSSAPLITSVADISGVLIYFSLATWLLEIA